MEAFPFSDAEWHELSEAVNALIDARLMKDNILEAVYFSELQEILHRLQEHYGNHPVILETEADVTTDPCRRLGLYDQALNIAITNGLPTYSIRISLAAFLLDYLKQANRAEAELHACKSELDLVADDFDKWQWQQLMSRCDAERDVPEMGKGQARGAAKGKGRQRGG